MSKLRPSVLLIEHGLGGGVERHVFDLIRLLDSRADFLLMSPARGGLLRVRHRIDRYPQELYFDPVREVLELGEFLHAVCIDRIHFHHTLRIPWILSLLPRRLGLPYDYTVHDYFSFCPQITLTSENFRYCGEPGEEGCNRCLMIRPPSSRENIDAWRSRHRSFVEGAARVFVPSLGVGERIERHFPRARIVLAQHPEQVETTGAPRAIRTGDDLLRIGVLGALNPPKGADLLEKCARDAAVRGLPVTFHLFGEAYRPLTKAPRAALRIHGRYRDTDLGDLLSRIAPHLLWFPSQWPETYSYTLSAAMRYGYPVAATDLGAFRDRLAGRRESWLLPWDTTPEQWNDFFVRLRARGEDRYSEAARRPPVASGTFSYERDYLVADSAAASATTKAHFDCTRFTRSWRARPDFVMDAIKEDVQAKLRYAYRIPGVRQGVTALIPEHRLQRLRRWLDRY